MPVGGNSPKKKDEGVPTCDCGYAAQGDTAEDRLREAQLHAWQAHGIEVSLEQIRAAMQATDGESRRPGSRS